MFDILIISVICSIFLTFFQYIYDNLNIEDEVLDIQKYISYFLMNMFSLSSAIFLYSLFYKSDIDSMNIDVKLPDF